MISKDIGRIRWRFNNCLVGKDGKKREEPLPMYINSDDLEALNGIIEYVNKEKERQLNNYHLFAKLYISSYTKEIYKTKGNYQLIADSLRMTLKRPLESIYDDFHQQINETEFENISKVLGLSDKHPILRTDQENENDEKIIKENAEDLTKALTHYNKEDVYNRLNSLLTNLIEDYG